MRPVTAITVGGLVGLCVSGLVAALAVVALPAAWRGQPLVWTVTALIVALSAWTGWKFSTPRVR